MGKLAGLRRVLRPFTCLRERRQEEEFRKRRQEIDRRQRVGLKHLPDVFAVVSWGCTATKWLAATLCAHPRIFCVHSFRYIQGPFFPQEAQLADLDSLNLIQLLGRGYALAGDVHGIDVGSVPQIRDYFGERFRAAAVTREPVQRLLSQISIFEQHHYAETVWNDVGRVRDLPGFRCVARHFADRKKRFFMYAAGKLNSILTERRLCPVYRMEDLTSRPEVLGELVSHLAGEKFAVDPGWAREVVARPAVNRHRHGPFRPTLSEPWQFEVLDALVQPEARDAYRRLGYATADDWDAARI